MVRTVRAWLFVPALPLLLAVTMACTSAEKEAELDDGAASAVAGQQVEADGGVYYDVSPEELVSMLESKDFVVVNVHIPYEGEIEGTDLFIPYDDIGGRVEELPSQLDAKIVLYCRSGSMSAIAASTLVGAGFTNVWNLDGGMIAWEEAGFPLVNAQ